MSTDRKERLIQTFHSFLRQGGSYSRINQARKQAEEVLGEAIPPGSPLTKVVDEAMEAAIVQVSPRLIAQSTTTHQAYDQLVDLLNRQPTLGVRSSTSVLQQAYSTPIPLAYLASTLAGIDPNTTVYEPTAGNGALLIGANPANVIANELNNDRLAELKQRSYRQLTQHDATTYRPSEQVDVVITNPPFGVVQEVGKVKRFEIPGNSRRTRQIDQAIAFRALECLKDDGRAVLILGGKLGSDEDLRSDRYNSIESRGFFYALYQQYNVTQHLSIWGDLYRKQGAGFPIDLILIAGRGQSQRDLPAADVPIIYKSFDALKELLPNEPIQQHNPSGVQQLSFGLEAAGRGRPISLSSQDPSWANQLDLGRLQTIADSPHSVADPSLAGAERRESGADSPQADSGAHGAVPPGIPESLPRQRDAGTGTPVVVDAGVGRDLSESQRDADRQISSPQRRSRVSPDDRGDRARHPAGLDNRTQRIHPGKLAFRPDLRAGSITPNQDTAQRTQTMVGTELGQSPAAPLNAAYLPRSQGRTPGTLIPANMATAAQTALDKLEQAVGNVDEFVRQRLGYASKQELWQHLYAEQIDANALAFWQRDNQKVFLNGDQTGNGKGRFCASQIVDAINQGYIPVFVTQKSTLYISMLADLQDIGKPGVSIFATDSNLKLDLPNGSKLRTGSVSEQEAEMQRLVQQGMGNYNAIFTTYSQLQTVDNGKEPFRRDFLRELAPRAIFIFDEAHEAGGSTGEKGWVNTNAAPNRAEFVRELVDRSAGAVFASATAIKDPAVMDLYARRSDAAEAVSHITSLQRTLKDGGVPLQQMMATKFVASGQMLRRERSFEGVSFQAKVVGVDRQVADDISSIMRAISQFDLAKQKSVEKLSKQLKKEAKAASEDNSIGQAGAKSMNFTSLMFNAIDQGLLCQKAEATVQEAIAAIGRGQKPVIAVASTMDSLIEQYAEDKGLSPGDPINISFGDVLSRYLERSRDVTIKNHEGVGIRRRMTDDELGDAVAAYDTAREIIDSTNLSAIPLSSIDYIKWRLGQSGFRVGEITGRQHAIDYSPNGEQGYARRSTKEITAQAKVNTVDRFNAGSLDVLILNRSGSTGINLHASEKFADQQQRHLIMAQAERDINQVMQMLGRVNRFGQVSEPEITYLMSDIPAEKRLGAILSKKMATLNANTTADRDSALSVSNVVDFLNPYGEEVIAEILEDNPQLEAKLAFPSEGLKGETDIELIGRVTGRIPLLSIQEQEELYSLIESETLDLIAQKQAMGESVLEAQQLDLDALTIGRMEVIPDNSPIRNEFTGPVYLDVVDAKVPVKPFSQLEAINLVRENLDLEPVKQVKDHDFAQAEWLSKVQTRKAINELREDTQHYRAATLAFNDDNYSKDKARERINKQFAHVSQALRDYPPGQSVRVVSPEGNITYGVMARVWQKSRSGSPAAPSNWRAQILTDNQARMLTIPLTRFNRGKEGMLTTISKQETNWEGQNIYAAFDLKQQDDRTERQIFQGNLLKAYEKYPTGQFLNYTDHQGKVQQGLVMPASFDIQESLREQPVAFQEPRQVRAFLTELTNYQGAVKTLDEVLTIKSQAAARFGRGDAVGFVLQTPKTGIGDRFSLNQDIIATTGSEFYSVSDRMELLVPDDRLDAVLQTLMKEQNLSLAAFDFKDKAREYLGVKLPELQQLEVEPVASPSPNPVRRESAIPLIPTEPAEEDSKQPQPVLEPDRDPTRIAPAKEQQGGAEKNIAKFLHEAGLSEAVLQGEDFHLRVENKPYIPLVVERHGTDLFVTHYLEQNGDLFMDSEMVFRIRGGNLQLQETGVQNPFRGGEIRACDRGFAQLFSRNLLDQGFAQAARESWVEGQAKSQPQEEAQGVMESLQASAEELRSIREGFQAIVNLGQNPVNSVVEVSPAEVEPDPVKLESSVLEQVELDLFQSLHNQNQVTATLPIKEVEQAQPAPSTPLELPVELLPVLDTQLVTTIDHLQETVDLYQNVAVLAIATRTTGLDPHADSIRLIQLAAADRPVSVIDCAALAPSDLQPLNRLFQGESEKVFQNASLDLQMLKSAGVEVKGNLFDTMIASQLLEAGLDRAHTLEAIVQRHLHTNLDKAEQTSWKNGLTQTQIGDAARDVALLLPLRDKLASRLAEKELTAIVAIEFRAVHGVAEMEWHGMGIHQEKLQAFADELRQQKAHLEQQLETMLSKPESNQSVDLDSPKQLLAALKQNGIPINNTRKETLIPLQDRYPVLSKLMEYRSVSKALSTYAEGYKALIHPKTGRLHPHLNQCGAVTGRFSCDKPNLQNVPRDPRIKGCFEPAPGNVLVKADYSQIELRIAAKLSGEPRMIQAYQNGRDLHTLTASLLLHKPTSEITGDERRLAKAVNFGLIYGMQAHGFQTYARTNYGVSLSLLKAEQHREQFFNTYSGLTEWHDRVKQESASSCRTLGGRLRQWEGEAPFTEIINAPVQGTSADITKLAIANFQAARDALPRLDAKLLMQVHDEIVIEVPAAQAARAGQLLVQAMREAGQHFLKEMPVEIEATICENWSGKNARPVPLEPQVEPPVVQPQLSETPRQKQIDSDLMKLAHSVRNLDLPTIAQHLGLERDRADKSKWVGWAEVNGEREKRHVISITDNKFMDWKTEQGGTGAVSLTMAVRAWDFKSAVEWLAQQKAARSIPDSSTPRIQRTTIPGTAHPKSSALGIGTQVSH